MHALVATALPRRRLQYWCWRQRFHLLLLLLALDICARFALQIVPFVVVDVAVYIPASNRVGAATTAFTQPLEVDNAPLLDHASGVLPPKQLIAHGRKRRRKLRIQLAIALLLELPPTLSLRKLHRAHALLLNILFLVFNSAPFQLRLRLRGRHNKRRSAIVLRCVHDTFCGMRAGAVLTLRFRAHSGHAVDGRGARNRHRVAHGDTNVCARAPQRDFEVVVACAHREKAEPRDVDIRRIPAAIETVGFDAKAHLERPQRRTMTGSNE
mmetsp:Transcript_7187/g.19254  ORF Transcript_7187/g.19254 Transcript_7187/m.19254 type:complete len:268 (-) Transcript_7187:102-905(-)